MTSRGKIQLSVCVLAVAVAGAYCIADGIIIPHNSAPHNLILRMNGTALCSATLVSATWLITAAQCVQGVTNASWVTVHPGELYAVATRPVVQLLAHPDFEPYTLDNDVALVHINETTPYDFTVDPVRAISVVEANYDLAPGTLANVTGYGPVTSAYPSARAANVTVISYDECQLQYYQTGLTDSMLCGVLAGASLEAGDAGGALVAHARAVAVASHQLRRRAGVFTRLALPRVRSFIQQHTAV